ncbi:hypothetical protein GCM10009863_56030 [Streptomyces axinellae]|uniref:Uncharacterized protein n=1 Tax=Streptomyces axinellae TaxID=552788 RepID=A0ABN3QQR5_9ACTN
MWSVVVSQSTTSAPGRRTRGAEPPSSAVASVVSVAMLPPRFRSYGGASGRVRQAVPAVRAQAMMRQGTGGREGANR